jgi:hypothetical protein
MERPLRPVLRVACAGGAGSEGHGEALPEGVGKRGALRAPPLSLSLAFAPRGGRVRVLGAF